MDQGVGASGDRRPSELLGRSRLGKRCLEPGAGGRIEACEWVHTWKVSGEEDKLRRLVGDGAAAPADRRLFARGN